MILIELVVGLIQSSIQTISFVVGKLYELAVSLIFISSFGVAGFVIAFLIGAGVFFFISRFILKTSKSILGFAIALVVMLGVLLFFSMVAA
ncbi:MAG: hypothetical protein JW701_00680 [Kosmotogaceae bacterium]|nr:hypothetical protein [Kosmotogaceae bacterium]